MDFDEMRGAMERALDDKVVIKMQSEWDALISEIKQLRKELAELQDFAETFYWENRTHD